MENANARPSCRIADLLEIGDVGLTFSTKLGEDIGGEETVMLRTVVADQLARGHPRGRRWRR